MAKKVTPFGTIVFLLGTIVFLLCISIYQNITELGESQRSRRASRPMFGGPGFGGPSLFFEFDLIDTDHNEAITRDEIADWVWVRTQEWDTDKDGSLTKRELEEMRERWRGPGRQRPPVESPEPRDGEFAEAERRALRAEELSLPGVFPSGSGGRTGNGISPVQETKTGK